MCKLLWIFRARTFFVLCILIARTFFVLRHLAVSRVVPDLIAFRMRLSAIIWLICIILQTAIQAFFYAAFDVFV